MMNARYGMACVRYNVAVCMCAYVQTAELTDSSRCICSKTQWRAQESIRRIRERVDVAPCRC